MTIGSTVWADGIIEYEEFVVAIREHEAITGVNDLTDSIFMPSGMIRRIHFGRPCGASQEGNVLTLVCGGDHYTITIDDTLPTDVMEFRTEDC